MQNSGRCLQGQEACCGLKSNLERASHDFLQPSFRFQLMATLNTRTADLTFTYLSKSILFCIKCGLKIFTLIKVDGMAGI